MDKPIKRVGSFKKLPPVPPPAKPTISQLPDSPGSMPPGTVLTEMERDGLMKLGVVADPSTLPANIAQRISEAVPEALPQVPRQNMKLPEPVDISQLSEEQRKKVTEVLNAAKNPAAALNSANFKETINDTFVVDDLPEPQAVEAAKAAPAVPVEEPAPPVDENKSESGITKQEPKACPHCGWELAKEDLVEINEEDKVNFVQCLLGDVRFKKKYSIFGGRMIVTFRSLTTKESDLAYKQLVVDAQKDVQSKIIGDTSFYWRTLMSYRCVMAVERIETEKDIIEVPTIDEIDVPEDSYKIPDTKLFPLFDDLVSQIMPNEVMRNTISHLYTEFQSLCDKLQTMAESRDFWKAIG